MFDPRRPGVLREWLAGLASLSLIVAPFGCQLTDGSSGGGGGGGGAADDPNRAGLFIGETSDGPLLLAARNAQGDALFAYGTRDAAGYLREVDSIVIRTAAGEESFILFESGRPTRVQGPDGSFARIVYAEVSAQRLAGTVELFDAASGATESHAVDIDLTLSAAQVAEQVRAATGRMLETVALDDFATAKALGAKADHELARITIFSPFFAFFVAPFVAIVSTLTIIVGQIVTVLFAVVSTVVRALVLAVFAPVFLLTAILGGASVRVELLPLSTLFSTVPPRPAA